MIEYITLDYDLVHLILGNYTGAATQTNVTKMKIKRHCWYKSYPVSTDILQLLKLTQIDLCTTVQNTVNKCAQGHEQKFINKMRMESI